MKTYHYSELDRNGRIMTSPMKAVEANTLKDALRKIAEEISFEVISIRIFGK